MRQGLMVFWRDGSVKSTQRYEINIHMSNWMNKELIKELTRHFTRQVEIIKKHAAGLLKKEPRVTVTHEPPRPIQL